MPDLHGAAETDGRDDIADEPDAGDVGRSSATEEEATSGFDVRRLPPWHPLLLAAWSVLAPWSGNVGDVPPTDGTGLLVMVVGVVAVAWVVLSLLYRAGGVDRAVGRAGLATTGGAAVVLAAGRVAPGLAPTTGLAVVGVVVLCGVLVAVMIPAAVVTALTTMGNVSTLVAVLLVATPVVTSVFDGQWSPAAVADAPEAGDELARDVWYIIPDRYPRADVAADVHGFDIGGFQDFLVDRGFTIQGRARANYPKTALSLGATWNLEYISELIPDKPEDVQSWRAAYRLLPDHRLGTLLIGAGLDYHHVGGWWWPTASAESATSEFDTQVPTEFTAAWRTTTALRWWRASEVDVGHDDRESRYDLIVDQLAELERVARAPDSGPQFVLAHVTVPHPPYVFNEDGSFATVEQARARSLSDNIATQTAYVNARLRTLVDLLVTGNEATDPIIVIQSDEGPTPAGIDADQGWGDVDLADRREKLATFSAWYLPGVDEEPPEDITGVNTWRFILDHYLDTDFGLLDDRVHVFPSATDRYEYVDVTDDFE